LIVLARLLRPQDFGLIAFAFVIIKPIQTLFLSGIERTALWSRNLDANDLAGLFWVSALIGAVLTIICALSATYAENLYDNRALANVLLGTSPLFFLGSLSATGRGCLRKNHQFGYLAIADIASYVIGFGVVGLLLAAVGVGVFSLVFAYLVQAALQFILAKVLSRQELRVRPRFALLEVPLAYGVKLSGMGFLEAIFAQILPASIGSIFGPVSLGLFTRAQSLAQSPVGLLGYALSQVLGSSFVVVGDDHQRLGRGIAMMMTIGSAVILPVAFGISAAAHEIVFVLLGSNWLEASNMLVWLALTSAATMLGHLMAALSEARAWLLPKFWIQLSTTAALVVAIYLLKSYGVIGVCIAALIAQGIFLVSYFILLNRLGHLAVRDLLDWLAPGLCAGLACAAASLIVSKALIEFAPIVILSGQIGACAIACFGMYRLFFPTLFFQIIQYAGAPDRLSRMLGSAE
jgi:O-antigen/teichoic acid export membrane protein